MRILIGNDDGFRADGLLALARELSRDHEVLVSAPDRECSATGHGITLRKPLRLTTIEEETFTLNGLSGLPADAMKFGLTQLCKDLAPDLVLSGINHGANTGQNVFYSGTVGAATEGTFRGIPSMALSLAGIRREHFSPENFAAAAKVARRLVERFQQSPHNPELLLNVNIPPLPLEEMKGLRASRMGYARFHDFFEERQDPETGSVWWLDGSKNGDDTEADSDDFLVHNGWVSISPLRLSLSHPRWERELDDWKLQEIPLS